MIPHKYVDVRKLSLVCKHGLRGISLQGRMRGVDILGSHCTYYIGEALQGRSTVHAAVILHSTCLSNSSTTAAWTGRHYLPSVSPSPPPSPLYSAPGIYSVSSIVALSLVAINVCCTVTIYEFNCTEKVNYTKKFAWACQSCLRDAVKNRFDYKSTFRKQKQPICVTNNVDSEHYLWPSFGGVLCHRWTIWFLLILGHLPSTIRLLMHN